MLRDPRAFPLLPAARVARRCPWILPSGWSPCFLLRGQQRGVCGTHAPQFVPGELKERGEKKKKKPQRNTRPEQNPRGGKRAALQTPGGGGGSCFDRDTGRGVMRTDRPATPGPPLSPHLDAGPVAAPQLRALAAATLSESPGAGRAARSPWG